MRGGSIGWGGGTERKKGPVYWDWATGGSVEKKLEVVPVPDPCLPTLQVCLSKRNLIRFRAGRLRRCGECDGFPEGHAINKEDIGHTPVSCMQSFIRCRGSYFTLRFTLSVVLGLWRPVMVWATAAGMWFFETVGPFTVTLNGWRWDVCPSQTSARTK